jgi:hypothetical protein
MESPSLTLLLIKKKKLFGEGVVSNQNDEGYFG